MGHGAWGGWRVCDRDTVRAMDEPRIKVISAVVIVGAGTEVTIAGNAAGLHALTRLSLRRPRRPNVDTHRQRLTASPQVRTMSEVNAAGKRTAVQNQRY